MENKWTNEQLEAITARDCNLLVAAAAGSGKTAVLVERIIRRITDEKLETDIDNLLIVTFTNASATEMRERIAEAIGKALESNPGSKNLLRQLTLINKASITTIHSFCLDVIKNNFQSIELDPKFKIGNESETELMKMEVIEELFDDIYEGDTLDDDFTSLLECFGGNRDDTRLQEMVLTLYEFIQSSPWPEEWLKSKATYFNPGDASDFSKTPWGKIIIKNTELDLYGIREEIYGAIRIISNTEELLPYMEAFQEDLFSLEGLLGLISSSAENKWDLICGTLSVIEFSKLPSLKKVTNKDRQEYVKDKRDNLKEAIKKLKQEIFFKDTDKTIADLKYMYPMIKKLCDLVMQFSERFKEKKRKRFMLDFNDLEHLCLEILTVRDEKGDIKPSDAAVLLKEKFQEILVDEYQDSNLVQEIIINMISRGDRGEPNVFMVGDVKQSIYRFRQAKPELFLEKYNSYKNGSNEPYRKILLFKNFRSRKEIIEGVNFIFRQIMSETAGELEYNEAEALNYGAFFEDLNDEDSYSGGSIELLLGETQANENPENEDEGPEIEDSREAQEEKEQEESVDAIRLEARLVLKKIHELTSPDEKGKLLKVYDRDLKAYRKVEYKDIVILLRTTKNWSDIFAEELGCNGVPVFTDTGGGFFKTVEIRIMLSLLQIIDNPLQDIPMLSVLRSPIGGFSEEELVDIRAADRNASFYDCLKKASQLMESGYSKKACMFLEKLQVWRDKAGYMPTDDLIWYLFNDTSFYSFVGAMPGGNIRQSNLRMLFDRAKQYEETSYKGLFNFINYINRLNSSKGDMGSAKLLSENENVVRIMSIHKSKGLEFPVVILSGCGKKFNLMDMNKKMLLHQDLGFGPDFVDYRRRFFYPSAPKQALKNKVRMETLSEEMRILYVAFTRAKEKLIITGTVNNVEKVLSKYSGLSGKAEEKLPAYEMLRATNYLGWLLPALLRHKASKLLRNKTDGISCIIEDPSLWDFKLLGQNEIKSEKAETKTDINEFMQKLDCLDKTQTYSCYFNEINRRLDWEYGYGKASTIPAKVSVTELKRRFAASGEDVTQGLQLIMPQLVKKPLFMEESKGLSAAEKGTMLHFALQHLDFNRLKSIEDIKAQLIEMVNCELFTEQQVESISADKMFDFFNSNIGSRLLAAEKVYREVPFNLEIQSRELYKDLEPQYGNENLLLQGVIDCYFEEDGEIVLLDYKTDYVPYGGTDNIKEKYRLQIDYYTKALEQLTGKRVKDRYLYLFWNGEVLEL